MSIKNGVVNLLLSFFASFSVPDSNLISGRMEKYGDMYTLKTDPKTGKMTETRTMSIHESDLKEYLKKGYITPELAKQCFQMLPEKRRDVSEKRR